MTSPVQVQDDHHLLSASEEPAFSYHWIVRIEFLVPGLTTEERVIVLRSIGKEIEPDDLSPWIEDELIVLAGADAREAIAKTLTYVADPERYGLPVIDVRITGVELLSQAEVL